MTTKMGSFKFWTNWLIFANIITVCVGLLVAFAGNSIFLEWHNSSSEQLFLNGQQFSGDLLKLKNWLFGIIGGSIVGFHALMIFIIKYAFAKKEKWAYIALWTGLISWFVIDSGISAYYQAYYNIIGINLVAVVLIGLPLIMTRKEFF